MASVARHHLDPSSAGETIQNNPRREKSLSFPRKLHSMLEAASQKNFEHVVSWQPGGKSFKVHNPKRFTAEIMKTYFNQTKYKSFQRQLNIYGFERFHHGPNKGGYKHKHEHFIRFSPECCAHIVRRGPSAVEVPEEEPRQDPPASSAQGNTATSSVGGVGTFQDPAQIISAAVDPRLYRTPLHALYGILYLEQLAAQQVAPVLQNGTLGRSEQSVAVREVADDDNSSDKHSFPWKLHLMLERAEKENYQHIVSWVKDGTSFKVHNSHEFVERIMPIYFDQTRFESFRRQLNLYGFCRVSRGVDRGVVSHPSFRKGAPYLCSNIKRGSS